MMRLTYYSEEDFDYERGLDDFFLDKMLRNRMTLCELYENTWRERRHIYTNIQTSYIKNHVLQDFFYKKTIATTDSLSKEISRSKRRNKFSMDNIYQYKHNRKSGTLSAMGREYVIYDTFHGGLTEVINAGYEWFDDPDEFDNECESYAHRLLITKKFRRLLKRSRVNNGLRY